MEEIYKEIYRDLLRLRFRIKGDGLYDPLECGGEKVCDYHDPDAPDYINFFYREYRMRYGRNIQRDIP